MYLAEKLNNIFFFSFDKISFAKVFKRISIMQECNSFRISFIHEFNRFVYNVLYVNIDNWSFKHTKEARVLFFTHYVERKSFTEQFFKAAELIQNRDLLYGKFDSHIRMSFLTLKILFFLYPIWMFNLFLVKCSFVEKMWIANELMLLYNLQLVLEKIGISKYNLLVCSYDSEIENAFVVEYFKRRKIKTATLQHGQFVAYREKILENCAIEFRSSNSDYFLCWNQFTADEALKEGLPVSKIRILGILGFIGNNNIVIKQTQYNYFGVIVGHPMFEEENIKLVKSANILSKEIGGKYYLKLHPNYSESHFSKITNNTYFLGNIRKGIPMGDYAAMVKFSISGSSSVLVEMVYLKQRILVYSTGLLQDKYKDIKTLHKFSVPEKVIECYNEAFADDKSLKSSFDYLCSIEDVDMSYKTFFEQYIND